MPESKARRRPHRAATEPATAKVDKPNAPWFKPVMITLMVVGLLWIITYYISDGMLPIPNIRNWNIGIGFLIAICGFMMTTRWRS